MRNRDVADDDKKAHRAILRRGQFGFKPHRAKTRRANEIELYIMCREYAENELQDSELL